MLKSLYNWAMAKAGSKNSGKWLAAVSFAESSFFPIPPDLLLVPMVLANRRMAWWFALIATSSSVIGGIAGYAIGMFLFDTLGQWVINLYGLQAQFETAARTFNEYGAEILIIKGMTPIPYKLLTITSGATGLNFGVFIGASLISRSVRFFLVAALLYFFGEPIRDFIEKRLTLVTTVFAILLIGGFVVIKFL